MGIINERMTYLMNELNELNVDQSTLPARVEAYSVGEWVEIIGDYVNASEYNPKLKKVISQTTFDAVNNPGPMELVSNYGPYWVTRTEEGRYYRIGNRELTGRNNFKKLSDDLYEGEMLDEGLGDFVNKLKQGLDKKILTAASIVMMLQANAQEPAKTDKIIDTVGQFADANLLKDLQNASGIEWDEATANRLFTFSPDEPKAAGREITDLNLGAYGKINVAKVSNVNHTESGGIKYTVDITNKSYIESGKIFDEIKNYNDNLTDIQIDFTYKGTPLVTKTINL